MKICLIGPFPEPVGGVSVHLDRLKIMLQSQCSVYAVDESPIKKESIPNLRKFDILDYFSAIYHSDVVHIHSSIPVLRFFHIIVASYIFRKRTITTIHSLRVKKVSRWQKKLYSRCYKIIVVNKTYRKKIDSNNVVLMPAFIPPIESNKGIPDRLKNWILEKKKNIIKIAISNAYRLDYYDGVDIYGLDLAIELAKRFKKNNDPIAIVFIVSSIEKDRTEFDRYASEIEENHLKNHILLIGGSIDFPALMKEADLVLRLTCTDGDALTIRESLWLGVSTLASDVVERPANCSLFNNRDIDSLYNNTKAIIFGDKKTEKDNNFDYLAWYLKLYKGI